MVGTSNQSVSEMPIGTISIAYQYIYAYVSNILVRAANVYPPVIKHGMLENGHISASWNHGKLTISSLPFSMADCQSLPAGISIKIQVLSHHHLYKTTCNHQNEIQYRTI